MTLKNLTLALVPCALAACSGARATDDFDAAPPIPDAAPLGALVINEVAAAGDPSDWFELYNHTAEPIVLDDYTFTDDPAMPAKGQLDAGVIAPGTYRMQVVDDAGVGFKLGSDEELWLYDPDGEVVDGVDWAEGESPAGGSYGRLPDGVGDFMTLATATPGAPNTQ